jgi:hypothetical protein
MVPTCALATVPGMSVPALRPLRVGEILDAGIKVYLKNARTLMGLTAVVVVPFQLLSAIVLLSSVSYGSQVPGSFPTLTAPRTGDHAASLGANVILQVTGVLIGLLTTAACVKAVSDIYLDQPTDVRSSLRFALRRLGSLFWVEVIVIVGLTFAFLALLIPGIWLYAAWSVTTPALLIEGRRGPSAIGRSFRLVRGRWWPTAGVRLLSNILIVVISGAITGVLVGILLAGGRGSVVLTVTVVSFAGAISAILTRPFQAAVTTILYYDLRVRHEGYDVELLAEQLGIEPTSLPAGALVDTGPEAVGQAGGPPFWPPPPGWSPPPQVSGADGDRQ